MYKKVFLSLLVMCSLLFRLHAQTTIARVDSLLQTLSLDEKIGQLFMVPVYANSDRHYLDEIETAVKSHFVGGIILMDGSISKVTQLIDYVQNNSTIPLFIGIDGAGGVGRKIDSAFVFPSNIALGALANDTLVYQTATEIAHQMKLLGINLNFGPSGDLIFPDEIDTPSDAFGSNKINVANKAVAFMRGLQDHGIMACAKRFPMQGITIVEVKKDALPRLNAYIDSTTIYPYRQLFTNGIKCVLPASTEFPLFYEKKKTIKRNKYSPALLSTIYAGQWLRKELDYKGLVFVSIPEIQNQTGKYNGGEAEVLAFEAGNDMILFPDDINPAIRKIKRLMKKEKRFEAQLDETVRKILIAKIENHLFDAKPGSPEDLYQELHTLDGQLFNKQLIANIVTVVKDEQGFLPIKNLDGKRFLTISMGKETNNAFNQLANKYTRFHHVDDRAKPDEIFKIAQASDVIILNMFKILDSDDKQLIGRLQTLESEKQIVVCNFQNPNQLRAVEKFNNLIQAYADDDETLRITAQAVFGALPLKAKLPLTVSPTIKEGTGVATPSLKRFQFALPEEAGLNPHVLEQIEKIAKEAIDIKATPGCHVLVARKGKIVYEKSFGYQTYANMIPVTDSTIYDLASVTKVIATLQAVMFMHDRGLIDYNKKASYYLPELKVSNKKDITIKEILTHQAGLWPFLPFWSNTLKDTVFLPVFYNKNLSKEYPYQVANHLYASTGMRDSLWHWIINAKMRAKMDRTSFDYKYSDMGFYIMQHLAEKVLNQPLEDFLNQNLYEPLGANTTGFLPLSRFLPVQIAPTENDKLFRRTLLTGTVHDQGAAMQGGVAGHAGLFSDARDLAKVGQMLLQQGEYGGIQYYKPETVKIFTRKQFDSSRRGLGWDRPIQSDWNSPTSLYASPKTFGHTGFTGTCIWVDPEFDLVYVFLSNRVHPSMTNNKLLTAGIRSRIQDVIYQSIFSYCENPILIRDEWVQTTP